MKGEFWRHGSNGALSIIILLGAGLQASGAWPPHLLLFFLGAILFFSGEYGFHRYAFHAPPMHRVPWLLSLQRRLHFDHHVELEAQLAAKGKTEILADVMAELGKPGEMSFVRQMQPLGLGHAVWCARDLIGEEPFAVMLPDMLMMASPGALSQAVATYEAVGGNIR